LAEAACEPTVFDGLNGLESVAAAARGDVAREPALNQVTQELPASAKGKGGKSFRASVPVYFHVVHAGGVGNISNKVIAGQMRVLNAAFAGFYGGRPKASRSTSPVSRGPTTRLGTRPVGARRMSGP
jgi:hypothetical protein